MLRLLLVLAFLSVAACSPNLKKSAGSIVPSAQIFGGKEMEDSEISRATVMVRSTEGNCSGSLIADNIVLTAAHCVPASGIDTRIVVIFSRTPDTEAEASLKIGVEKYVVHPKWNSDKRNTGDLAILLLKKAAPATSTPLTISSRFPNINGSKVMVVGYGITDPTGKTSSDTIQRYTEISEFSDAKRAKLGEYLKKQNMIDDLEALNLDVASPADRDFYYFDQTENTGACNGDSGGPSILKTKAGKPNVIGVASFVLSDDSTVHCSLMVAYTSTYFYRQWINETAKLLNLGL